jgi:chemotaxis protein MotB
MADADPTQQRMQKLEGAVKKLKAVNEKAAKKLEDQKGKYQKALDKAKMDLEKEQDNVKKGEDRLTLKETQTKDQLENQKTKLNEDWEKKFEEAGLKKKPAEKKSSGDKVPLDYIPGGVEPWMATFADMVTLLMVFFVLFYSVEKDNTEKFKSAIDMMIEEDGPDGLAKIMKVVDSTKVMKNLKEMRDASKANTEDTIEKKVVLRVPGLNLFKKGGAKLRSEARPVLNEIVKVINKKGKNYKIFIQGHTDDVPINTPKFESNWELSAVRATSVLRYFYDKGIEPERLTATGYADTFPMVPNNTKEGRAKNRRIEFVLEKMPEKKSKNKKVDGRENMKPKKA